MVLIGPPSSGKTELSKKLSAQYGVPHLQIKTIIDEALAALEKSAATLALPVEQGGPEDPTEAEVRT